MVGFLFEKKGVRVQEERYTQPNPTPLPYIVITRPLPQSRRAELKVRLGRTGYTQGRAGQGPGVRGGGLQSAEPCSAVGLITSHHITSHSLDVGWHSKALDEDHRWVYSA